MKRLLTIFIFGLLLFGFASAATGDLRDWMDNLNDEIPFGYTATQKISVVQIAPDKVLIASPVITDELGNKIKKYTVMFSQYPLSQMLENAAFIDQSMEKTFEFTTVTGEITLELTTTADGVAPNTVYYLSIIPKDENGILGEISNELWFKLATQTYGSGLYTDSASDIHTAAGANMSLANITHTITDNRATLRWTAVDGSDKIDLFVWNPTSSVFERLAIVNMTDETYTFALTRNGEYIVNFASNNAGTEYRYTFVANGITATATTVPGQPVIGKIPATGPKENILIAFAIAFVVYLIYRRTRVKAKH